MTVKILAVWLLIGILLSPSPARASDYHVHASGDILCLDNSDTPIGLGHARIELMDSDADGSTIFDDVMATGVTGDDGHFELDGFGGDPGNFGWSRPDVYVRVTLIDGDATLYPTRLTDELNDERTWDSPEHDHDNSEGNVQIGAFRWGTSASGNRDNSSQCGVWLGARRAYTEYLQITGQKRPPYHYDVEYWSGVVSGTPWTNTDTSHWPVHYHSSAVAHEFGHAARHSLDGSQDEFNLDVVRFVYAQYHGHCETHNEGFAFNEGWAEYWAGDTASCNGPPFRSHVEGDVAAFLSIMAGCAGGRGGMLDVLAANAHGIHSVDEFRDALKVRNPSCDFGSYGVSHEGLVASTPSTVSFPLSQARLAQLEQAATEASQHADSLGQAAGARRACNDVEDCRAVTQTILDAISWRVRARLLTLAAARVRAEVAGAEAITARLREGTFNAWYATDKATYLAQVQSTTLDGLREATARVEVLAAHSPQAQLFVAPLQAKVTRAEVAVAAGKHIPAADPILVGGGDPTAPATMKPPAGMRPPIGCLCDLVRPGSTNASVWLALAIVIAFWVRLRVRRLAGPRPRSL